MSDFPFRVETADGIVRVEVRAPYSLAQFRALVDQLAASPAPPGGRHLLWVNHQPRSGITPAEVRAAIDTLEWKLKDGPLALALVSSSEVVYGIQRVVMVYCEYFGVRAEIFDNEEEARAWLLPG